MATVPSPLDPTPARGLAYDLSRMDPEEFVEHRAGVLTVAPGVFRIYNETGRDLALDEVQVSVGTAPTGAALIVDVNVNGTSVFTDPADRPTVAAGANRATADAGQAAFAPGAYLTVDVDQVGSTVAGSDLRVSVVAVLA